MAYHLYGVGSGTGHLGKLNSGGWHLVYGDGTVILKAKDYHAYQIGHYTSAGGYYACDSGFIQSKIGRTPRSTVINLIGQARNMILNDTGYWLSGNYKPHLCMCCGSTALGCFGHNTGTNEIAMQSGVYFMIPRYKFQLPAGHVATKAEIVFKGYSDYMIEAHWVGTGSWNKAAYEMKEFRLDRDISGYNHNMYNDSSYWDTRCTDLLIANASTDPDELSITDAFYASVWNKRSFSSNYQYSRVLAGNESAIWSGYVDYSKNLAWYLGNNNNFDYNPFFVGAIGTNAFKNGGSESYTYGFPYCQGNDGTKTYYNSRGAKDGENFEGTAGYVYKKIGGHWYTDSMLDSTARSDSSWLVKSSLELTSWQLNALNRAGYIWIMVSNPSPWFCTNDTVDTHGASRQIFLEDFGLKVTLA